MNLDSKMVGCPDRSHRSGETERKWTNRAGMQIVIPVHDSKNDNPKEIDRPLIVFMARKLKRKQQSLSSTMGNAMKKANSASSKQEAPASKGKRTILIAGQDFFGPSIPILTKLESMIPKAKKGSKEQGLKLPGGIIEVAQFGGRMSYPYFSAAGDGLILVVDSTWTEDSKYLWFKSRYFVPSIMMRNKDNGGKSRLPILVLCEKQDQPNALSTEKIQELLALSMNVSPIKFMGCSTETGQGLIEGLEWLNEAMNGCLELPPSTSVTSGKEEEATEATEESLDYDPEDIIENPALANFAVIQKGTQCPFAKRAKLWGGKPTSTTDSLEDQAAANAPALNEFVRLVKNGKSLDGFCIDLDDESARSGGPEGLGECVRRVLTTLSDLDPASADSMKTPMVSSRGWKFQFAACEFFVTTFAPFYPSSSSRFAFGSERAFLLLQPLSSFKRLPDDKPESKTDYTNPKDIRDKTRKAFRDNGRPYHVPETISYSAAEHIVKPLQDDGKETSVIRWWAKAQESN